MRQVKQTLWWGGVFRAIFTLMVAPELANGLPMNPRNSRTLNRSTQTTGRRSNGQLSTRIDTLRNFSTHDGSAWRGPEKSTIANNTGSGEFIAIVNKSRTWPSGEKENPIMYRLHSKWQRRATNELLKRQTRTLLSLLNKRSISQSKDRPHIMQRTTTNFKTILPQRKRRSRRTLLSRPMADDQISANILNSSVTTYQGLNSSLPLSSTINESNSLDEFNSSSDSFSSLSSTWASLPSYLEDDIHVNRTDGMLYNNSRLHRNRLRGFNISNLLRLRKCQENLTNWTEGNNDSSVRIRRRRSRGVESEGCQVLNVANGYLSVDPQGLVSTTWQGDDKYTRLYIFSIGPGYSRIKGIAANRYIHMDDAGAVYGIPASEVPEPYDATNTRGAWYEVPGTCQGSRWIQWYRKGGTRNELRWYLAFNRQGRPIRTQRTHANMCYASFMKTLSAGVSCNPNDGGYTNN